MALTHIMPRPTILPMAEEGMTTEGRLDSLNKQLSELVQVCERLKAENSALRAQQQSLTSERAQLVEKNEQARGRVESMILRLKSMEASS